MIEPPKTIRDCREIYHISGIRPDLHPPDYASTNCQYFRNAAILAALLSELEALREKVTKLEEELAGYKRCELFESDGLELPDDYYTNDAYKS